MTVLACSDTFLPTQARRVQETSGRPALENRTALFPLLATTPVTPLSPVPIVPAVINVSRASVSPPAFPAIIVPCVRVMHVLQDDLPAEIGEDFVDVRAPSGARLVVWTSAPAL